MIKVFLLAVLLAGCAVCPPAKTEWTCYYREADGAKKEIDCDYKCKPGERMMVVYPTRQMIFYSVR